MTAEVPGQGDEVGGPGLGKLPTLLMNGELLSDQVHRHLRRAIVRGEIESGQRLVESDLARRLGVSQAPVRDAVKRLVHEGLAVYQARRGSFVAEVSEGEAAAARSVRAVLEAEAARQAILQWTTVAQWRLNRDVEAMDAAAAADDAFALREADLAFHRHVVEAAENPYLLRAWTVLESSFYLLGVIGDPFHVGDLRRTAQWHRDLLDLLESRDIDRAVAEFGRHAASRPGDLT
ncbi:GntR family transcriptional regulator [Kineosporia succinea]|uniref:DNA-binding GntR family transcriptional regulator n=1 Tax=Kineosporia succinea TaxID=84632 RepID=A0ABT9NVA6_9ACTN|nr:GntR family transcriptional regulator [Kineosporia succinea]MDP9824359.1 DNA-binding GntR family transcriptional regulator [Kineosporia succinea]